MGKLIYSFLTSLDGHINDERGNFEWAVPDAEVHAFINDLTRSVGTHLYGRRLYELMVYWETADRQPDQSPAEQEFASMWQSADKIVYSTSLESVGTTRTRLERSFDVSVVNGLKQSLPHDMSVGGAGLAADALRAGIVDEIHQYLSPVIVGGGTCFLPHGVHLDLKLLDERRFGNGMVFVRYGVGS